MEKASRFRVAVCQLRVSHDTEANFRKIVDSLADAKAAGADIAVLPECAVSGYPAYNSDKSATLPLDLIESLNRRLPEEAHRLGIACVVGTVVRVGDKLRNSALVIDEDGNLLGRADKLHLIASDVPYFEPGDELRTFSWHGVEIGVLVCYDIRFPEPFRILKQMGAEAVFVPLNACGGATWKVPVMEATFRTRAAENVYHVIAANAAGPLQMCVSRVCDPDGLSLAAANQDMEEIIYADINLGQSKSAIYQDRRVDMFKVSLHVP